MGSELVERPSVEPMAWKAMDQGSHYEGLMDRS